MRLFGDDDDDYDDDYIDDYDDDVTPGVTYSGPYHRPQDSHFCQDLTLFNPGVRLFGPDSASK